MINNCMSCISLWERLIIGSSGAEKEALRSINILRKCKVSGTLLKFALCILFIYVFSVLLFMYFLSSWFLLHHYLCSPLFPFVVRMAQKQHEVTHAGQQGQEKKPFSLDLLCVLYNVAHKKCSSTGPCSLISRLHCERALPFQNSCLWKVQASTLLRQNEAFLLWSCVHLPLIDPNSAKPFCLLDQPFLMR